MKSLSFMLLASSLTLFSCGSNDEKSPRDTYMPAPGSDSATVDSNRTNGYAPPNIDTTDTVQ